MEWGKKQNQGARQRVEGRGDEIYLPVGRRVDSISREVLFVSRFEALQRRRYNSHDDTGRGGGAEFLARASGRLRDASRPLVENNFESWSVGGQWNADDVPGKCDVISL